MLHKYPLWLEDVEKNIYRYLKSIEKPNSVGRYLPCLRGVSDYGIRAELGFSCFAMRIYYSFDWWDDVPNQTKLDWINYINSYQLSARTYGIEYHNSYIDPALIEYLKKPSLHRFLNQVRSIARQELLKKYTHGRYLKAYERAIVAETKQAISTLYGVGVESPNVFNTFPRTPIDIKKYMAKFDWSLPWDAGGQTASLAVFLVTQGPKLLEGPQVEDLKQAACEFYRSIVDPPTGSYYQRQRPKDVFLVNGAMKVLTALDWLGEDIHYPEKLIDTVLRYVPESDGCHLVDSIYVMYRCTQQVDYRRLEVEEYYIRCLDMIKAHHNSDGGFSYSIGKAQKWYYGLPISKGLDESDIHGTILLVWALTMISTMLWPQNNSWNVIRP